MPRHAFTDLPPPDRPPLDYAAAARRNIIYRPAAAFNTPSPFLITPSGHCLITPPPPFRADASFISLLDAFAAAASFILSFICHAFRCFTRRALSTPMPPHDADVA